MGEMKDDQSLFFIDLVEEHKPNRPFWISIFILWEILFHWIILRGIL